MKKAFTLIEVLIVVFIVGILAVASLPAYGKLKKTIEYKETSGILDLVRAGAKYYDLKYGIGGLPVAGAWDYLKISQPAGSKLIYQIVSGPKLEICNSSGAWLYRYTLPNGPSEKNTGHDDFQYLPSDLP
ncbi:MAG: prepilin-type N-terminal cleavage/methylation domain-containing protein [Candidatus Omnitrophota bacterium]|jgi:prepilin-type N-terminal cleavage/methylation domain-containing protein